MNPLLDLPTHFAGVSEKPIVTRVAFEHSGVHIEGRFQLNEFATLERDHLEFLRLYIRVRGNLKEVERLMGVSYPTVRTRFEAMLTALEVPALPAVPTPPKTQTISALEKGEIDLEEALRRLEQS